MWYILLFVYVVGIIISYFAYWNKKENKSEFEKIWFSFFWPCVIIWYPVHYFYNKYKKDE